MANDAAMVRSLVDRVLGKPGVQHAARLVQDATAAVSTEPITDARDAADRRLAWEYLGMQIDAVEISAAPYRRRLLDLQKTLKQAMDSILTNAKHTQETARKLIGAWDTDQLRKQRIADLQARTLSSREELQARAASPPDAASPTCATPAGPPPAPSGSSRTVWSLAVGNPVRIAALIAQLPAGHVLREALRVHEPTLRRLLANQTGTARLQTAKDAGVDLTGEIVITSESRAIRTGRKGSAISAKNLF